MRIAVQKLARNTVAQAEPCRDFNAASQNPPSRERYGGSRRRLAEGGQEPACDRHCFLPQKGHLSGRACNGFLLRQPKRGLGVTYGAFRHAWCTVCVVV